MGLRLLVQNAVFYLASLLCHQSLATRRIRVLRTDRLDLLEAWRHIRHCKSMFVKVRILNKSSSQCCATVHL